MTAQESLTLLKSVMSRYTGGGFGMEDRQKLDTALAWARSHSRTGKARMTATELEDWLKVFESPKRQRKYPGGILQIRSWILDCIEKLEVKLEQGRKTDTEVQTPNA